MAGLQSRLAANENKKEPSEKTEGKPEKSIGKNVAPMSGQSNNVQQDEKLMPAPNKNESLLEVLVTPTTEHPNMPYSLLPKKKRKDKKHNLSIKR